MGTKDQRHPKVDLRRHAGLGRAGTAVRSSRQRLRIRSDSSGSRDIRMFAYVLITWRASTEDERSASLLPGPK